MQVTAGQQHWDSNTTTYTRMIPVEPHRIHFLKHFQVGEWLGFFFPISLFYHFQVWGQDQFCQFIINKLFFCYIPMNNKIMTIGKLPNMTKKVLLSRIILHTAFCFLWDPIVKCYLHFGFFIIWFFLDKTGVQQSLGKEQKYLDTTFRITVVGSRCLGVRKQYDREGYQKY